MCKCHSRHLSFYISSLGKASFYARPPVASFPHKQPPIRNLMRIANEHHCRPFLRRTRRGQELQAGFVREAVRLALVHVLGRPDRVFPGVLAAARVGHDVIQAALVRAQYAARALAVVAVALADGAGAELWALLRHLGVIHRHNDGRHANQENWRARRDSNAGPSA
jgi:hypothetical protein